MSNLRVTNLGREEEKGDWRPSREWAQGLSGCPSVTKSECMKVFMHLGKTGEKAVNKGGELVLTNGGIHLTSCFWAKSTVFHGAEVLLIFLSLLLAFLKGISYKVCTKCRVVCFKRGGL